MRRGIEMLGGLDRCFCKGGLKRKFKQVKNPGSYTWVIVVLCHIAITGLQLEAFTWAYKLQTTIISWKNNNKGGIGWWSLGYTIDYQSLFATTWQTTSILGRQTFTTTDLKYYLPMVKRYHHTWNVLTTCWKTIEFGQINTFFTRTVLIFRLHL